ncbi:uncharacterized protein LOC127657637 [Xyrauchen texanus]|uniref:uncharacterized protein LOC127657637 n=1 Tax=Xyrauchen texanus TaxID=154827 RepID=UPI002241FF4F|nr:uncharacterized protein LOC127657637 [Xyrauchen texanus]
MAAAEPASHVMAAKPASHIMAIEPMPATADEPTATPATADEPMPIPATANEPTPTPTTDNEPTSTPTTDNELEASSVQEPALPVSASRSRRRRKTFVPETQFMPMTTEVAPETLFMFVTTGVFSQSSKTLSFEPPTAPPFTTLPQVMSAMSQPTPGHVTATPESALGHVTTTPEIMSGLKEILKDAVLSVLPSLSQDLTEQLVEKLMDQGVEGLDDLVYVKEDDIAAFIRPIQCRKLLGAWKVQENLNSTVVLHPAEVLPLVPHETTSTLGSPLSSSSSTSASSPASTSVSHSWPENFKVPWNLMPAGIHCAVTNGQRPSPADRRQMIRVLADEIRKHDNNPTRSQCLTITRQIVRQYPKSFADMICDRQVGGGYESLLLQLKVRIEHLNRKSTLSHHRTQNNNTGTSRKRSSIDAYGCSRWQPDVPPGESYDSLEVKRQRMDEIYLHEGISGAERGDVCKLMEGTYCLQRQMINATPSPTMTDLRNKWPYLFIQRHIQ